MLGRAAGSLIRLGRSLNLAQQRVRLGRVSPGLVRTFSIIPPTGQENSDDIEKLVEESKKAKEQSKKNRITERRILKEKFAFTQDQIDDTRLAVQKIVTEYANRYKFIEILDETVLNKFLMALISVKTLTFLQEKDQMVEIMSDTAQKVFTLKNFEVILKLFEAVMNHKLNLTEDAEYQLAAIMVSWGVNIDLRKKISVLALVPPELFPKYKSIFEQYETLFIQYFTTDVDNKTPADYLYLIDILKIYRRVGYPDLRFVDNLEDQLADHIPQLKPINLLAFLLYITRTPDISIDRREDFLKKLDDELVARARFMSENEAVDVLLQLVKTGAGSKLTQRLLLAKINEGVENISKDRKILLINSLAVIKHGFKEKKAVAKNLMSHALKTLEKIDRNLLFELLFVMSETEMGTKEFFQTALKKSINLVYQFDFSQLSKLAWINLKTIFLPELHTKILERLKEKDLNEENLLELNIKDLACLVWTLGSCPKKEEGLFVFEAFEDLIVVKNKLSFKEVSQILWAVTLKYKIATDTFRQLVRGIREHLMKVYGENMDKLPGQEKDFNELMNIYREKTQLPEVEKVVEDTGNWELMNIIWGLSRFQSKEAEYLLRLLSPLVISKADEFSPAELLMIFRVYCEEDYLGPNGGQTVLGALVNEIDKLAPLFDQEQLTIIMFLLVNSKKLQFKDHSALLKKLFEIMEEQKKKIDTKDNIIDEQEEEDAKPTKRKTPTTKATTQSAHSTPSTN